MDESLQRYRRDWVRNPGDREAFSRWWNAELRAGSSELEIRIRESGLFAYEGQDPYLAVPVYTHLPSRLPFVEVARPFAVSPRPYLLSRVSAALPACTWAQVQSYATRCGLRLPTRTMLAYGLKAHRYLNWPVLHTSDIRSGGPGFFDYVDGAEADSLWRSASVEELVFQRYGLPSLEEEPSQASDAPRAVAHGLSAPLRLSESEGNVAESKDLGPISFQVEGVPLELEDEDSHRAHLVLLAGLCTEPFEWRMRPPQTLALAVLVWG